ncbi:uncharacterized protein LOC144742222 [Lampetra planeri]
MPRGLSCSAGPQGPDGRYETPLASELQRLMWTKKGAGSHLDEVYHRVYIGDMYAAKDKRTLQAHHITHVLNAADGKFNVNTGSSFYRDTNITYHGVEAFDMPSFDLSPFFYPAANFIKNALSSPTGRVCVHCAMGLSRSAALVLAYLMIHENMTLAGAVGAVGANRNIAPNAGFLEQLRELDAKLHGGGSTRSRVRRCRDADMSPEEEPEYQTPPTCDLLGLLLKNRRPAGAVDEVWPDLYVGDVATARDKALLVEVGITHVVNAAHGPRHVDTGAHFYEDAGVVYRGVEAPDRKDFDLSPFFADTADFLHSALNQRGKVLVHCARGISRSAALVLAFLMIKERHSVMEAVQTVGRHRNILPNVGFLHRRRRR